LSKEGQIAQDESGVFPCDLNFARKAQVIADKNVRASDDASRKTFVVRVDSQQRKCFGVGDELCAFVVGVDAFKRQVDFAIALGSEAPRKRDRSKGRAKVKNVSG
jgi:hypothetical protein